MNVLQYTLFDAAEVGVEHLTSNIHQYYLLCWPKEAGNSMQFELFKNRDIHMDHGAFIYNKRNASRRSEGTRERAQHLG